MGSSLPDDWYSSGDGELVGVVLRTGGAGLTGESDPMKNVITTWGKDVVVSTNAPPTNQAGQGPAAANFTGFQRFGANLTLDEQPLAGTTGWTEVDVAGYPVQYSQDRGLWFADIARGAKCIGI
jgi:hypothetical protein